MRSSLIARRRALFAAPALLLSRAAGAAVPLRVVASMSIIADLLRQVGGRHVAVTSLIGPEQDAHGYQPRPSDGGAIAAAGLAVVNGLGLEPWAERLAAAGHRGTVVVASRGVRPLAAGGGGFDPHAWQDVANVKLYVANIRDGLAAADPANAGTYHAAGAAYLDRLERLEGDIRAAWQSIARKRRKVVTSHDAFAYYGGAYGVDFLAPQGLSTEGEPSARGFAALIAQIRAENVRALFIENISRSTLLEQVARETGVRVGGTLYSDALSRATGPAATYEAMMRHNTRLLTAALA
jgi:zinc/manganese transport system substrate-binding protein